MDIYRMSDEIIAISPFLKNISTKLLGKNISFLPLGVDTSQFVRNSPARNSRPQVVCAGHVAAHKRPEKFLEWASLYPMADFSWYGEGPLRSILIHKAKHQGLLNVSFPGELPRVELADRFKGGDIFALPSLSEGVPKVTQEAAAAGLAQVIFGFYESPTVVEGENGFVVWNDDEFTQRLGQLVEDRTLVAKMGRTGSEMARQWEWDLIAPLWEEMIFRFVKNNRGPESRPVRNL
jgi:glycosyltransferase involved in cell wall biosynthesis